MTIKDSAEQFERLASEIASLDKTEVLAKLENFDGGFKLDFPASYLESLSIDRLKHILLAALSTKYHI